MALQVQSGYLVLLIDIGSEASSVISDKKVSDNKWYKATVERYFYATNILNKCRIKQYNNCCCIVEPEKQ